MKNIEEFIKDITYALFLAAEDYYNFKDEVIKMPVSQIKEEDFIVQRKDKVLIEFEEEES